MNGAANLGGPTSYPRTKFALRICEAVRNRATYGKLPKDNPPNGLISGVALSPRSSTSNDPTSACRQLHAVPMGTEVSADAPEINPAHWARRLH